ncbi:MAG TPA: thioesterase family protein [Fimbriiglobus sp.]|nr:thioesterase family protein [Fimbriiglobus sp.]
MPTPFQTTRRVEFGDTDMVGIVHFANFFRYMEAAETDFLRARGLSVAWQKAGERYGFPRVSAACDYVRPARFEDVLTIAVTVEKVGRKSVTYRHDFTLSGEPIASGRITAVCCRKGPNGELESVDIPPDVRAVLES